MMFPAGVFAARKVVAMKRTITYVLAVFAVLNMVWLFAFDYRLPFFRSQSAGEETIQPVEIEDTAEGTKEAEEQEEQADVTAPVSEAHAPTDEGAGAETETVQENVQETTGEPEERERTCRVAEGNIPNLRSGPGSNYDVVGSAYEGEILTVTGPEEDGWLPIRNADGLEGYVFAGLVVYQDQ